MPKVTPKNLLVIAGLVWFVAGVNVFYIGYLEFISNWQGHVAYIFAILLVFIIFMMFIFYPLVNKHYNRIKEKKEERTSFYKFFDTRSYLIMVIMISGGFLIRKGHFLPSSVIGVLYCGIGLSLAGAGVLLLKKAFKIGRFN